MNGFRNADKDRMLTSIGITVMILLVLTKFTSYGQLTGYSIFVGLACFFLVEWLAKTPNAESGLRFNTFFADLKRCGALFWLVLPIISSIVSILFGSVLFDHQYVDHVLGRTDLILDYRNLAVLAGQFIVAALGEEISFRGFFVGKGMKLFGFWPAALLSSAVFALAHLAGGNTAVVIYDLAGIFIDAIIYSVVYRRSGNCLISTVSHFLVNMVGIIFVFLFF